MIIGCAVVGGLGALALLVVLVGVLYIQGADEVEVTDRDREILITMDVMAEWFDGWEYSPELEEWDKLRYPDGTWEIGYIYDSPPGEEPIYLQTSLADEKKVGDARFAYTALEKASRASLRVFGGDDVKIVERPELMSWGDQSTTWIIESEVGPVGNFFLARKGSRIVHYYCIGVYFDERSDFESFLAPMIENAENHAFEGEAIEP